MKLRYMLLLVSAFFVVGCTNISNFVVKQSEAVRCDYDPVAYSLFSADGQLDVVDQCEQFNKAHSVRVLRLNVVNNDSSGSIECDIVYSEFTRTVYLHEQASQDIMLWQHTNPEEKPLFSCKETLDISSLF